MNHLTATYSPDDNKLRLYSLTRLDAATYARVKAAGFSWAPKQELFVAPMWTPEREDLLLELCGEIGDEDTSLTTRAEERADRFEDYSEKRAKDADRAHAAVAEICEHIPLGQPILVGHHSERHARKHAEKIENGMRKAVKMWETSKYWTARAAGAIRNAKYKERPDVRARRIKTIEAAKRKIERRKAEAVRFVKTYQDPEALAHVLKDGRGLVAALLNTFEGGLTCDERTKFEKGETTFDAALQCALDRFSRNIADCDRWISHYENRLTYERALLDEQGGSDLLKPKKRPDALPLCNYRAPGGIECPNIYHRGEMVYYPQVEMTKAEYASIHSDYKGTRVCENSHRVRTAMQKFQLVCVFLTDSKEHEKPPAVAPVVRDAPIRPTVAPPATTQPAAAPFEHMREQLAAGVQVVAAPQLFPTPPSLAARMVELADISPGHTVLEPSAGTGAILDALRAARKQAVPTAIEIDFRLADRLRLNYDDVKQADFLKCNGELGQFDRILMNPPFGNAQDIEHIKHALHMLKPGGRLVAVCANGPRQQAALQPLGEWIELPADTFKTSGTSVRTALLVVDA